MCVCVCVCVCTNSSQDGGITLPEASLLPPTLKQLHDEYEVVGGPEVQYMYMYVWATPCLYNSSHSCLFLHVRLHVNFVEEVECLCACGE